MTVKWHGAEYKMINATENDLQRIIDWKLDTIIGGYPGEDIPSNEKQKMINYVNNEAQMYLKNTRMILVNDQIVGMLIAYDKDGDWFIDDIYIIPEFRSHGIGFHVLSDECDEHETLSLYVYKSNTKAIRLYNRCGFSVTEVTGDRYFMRRDPNIKGECISYAMGIKDGIDEVRLHMDVEDTNDGDYEVIFPSNRSWEWELFISEHLEDTYWNEYIDLTTHKIHFMFNENGFIDHVINNGFDENPELLSRCNRLCEQDFKTMKDLIYSNTFYRTTLEQEWGDKMVEPVTEAFFKEAYLKAKERNALKDSEFGIPELRKYPLTDETHINMAVKFFGKAPKKYKLSLAKRILRAAHSHDMDTDGWDTINDYIKNHKESVVQEGFFEVGFGNLRKTVADKLGKSVTVTNVQNPTGKEAKFVIKSNEHPEDYVNVIAMGNGVKAYGYKNSERVSIFNNASLSAAMQKLIDSVCDLFDIQKPIKESYTERKNFIMKEQITKILEAYNSGVLTQEEASVKIESIQEQVVTESATTTTNDLREKQEKIMESFKMGIINATEGMRLIERVMMEADFITEEEDTAYEGDDNDPEDITPEDTDGDTIDSDDSNIDALADYINSLSDDEKTALMSKLSGSDEPTDDDANGNEEVPTDDAEGEPTTEETVDPASISDASLNDANASLDDMEV